MDKTDNRNKAYRLTPEQGDRLDELFIRRGMERANALPLDEPLLVDPRNPASKAPNPAAN